MKKITFGKCFSFLFVACLSLLLFSCADNNQLEVVKSEQDNNAAEMYQQVLNADNFETKKVIAESMSDVELVKFWQHHMQVLMSNNEYSDDQLAYFQKTDAFANDIITGVDARARGIICATVAAYFDNNTNVAFTPAELNSMFTLDAFATEGQLAGNNANDRSMVGCTCNSTWNCALILGTTCVGAATSGCDTAPIGCGWWLICPCLGWCM